MTDPGGLAERFSAALEETGAAGPDPLVVAFSGGLDSCVLLHLIHFTTSIPVVAAHFDHGMRPDSAGDALWARGLCGAWGIPFEVSRADDPPSSEAEAREARYRFLHAVRDTRGAAWLVTAHHADDQAETVLFRALRGSGLEGLRGIPETRPPGVLRPLLPFWREELLGYADAVGLRWREDPTNEQLGYARNVLRHEILPTAEARVAPGARRALVRLGRLAAANEEAWAEVIGRLLPEFDLRPAPAPLSGLSLEAEAVSALPEALRGRVLRHLADTVGYRLDEAATGRASELAAGGASGARAELGGGLELRRELDRLVLGVPSPPLPDRTLEIPGPGEGEGGVRLGGAEFRISWETGPAPGPGTPAGPLSFMASFPLATLAFPLTVRGRRAGDRMDRPAGGTGRIKKILLEARVPPGGRDAIPLLVDGHDVVLWIAGIAGGTPEEEGGERKVGGGAEGEGREMMTIRIEGA